MEFSTNFTHFREYEVPKDELIISRTDLNGVITYANEMFSMISGYSIDELVGSNHNIIRHPDMPKLAFRGLWETIKIGQIWRGHVKNKRRDGSYYWVYTEISSIIKDGKIVEYKSMRSFVEKNKRYEMQDVYDWQRENEDGIYRIWGYVNKEELRRFQ